MKVDISAPCPQLHYKHGQFLMTLFSENGYCISHLKALNQCCLFLQVSSLSDITYSDDASILECFWTGYWDPLNLTHHTWPGCVPPSSHDWASWHTALHSLFNDNAPSGSCQHLWKPLEWCAANYFFVILEVFWLRYCLLPFLDFLQFTRYFYTGTSYISIYS